MADRPTTGRGRAGPRPVTGAVRKADSTSTGPNAAQRVAEAIEATEPARNEQVSRTAVLVLDTTKRRVALQVPVDMSVIELLDLASWITSPTEGLWEFLRPTAAIVGPTGQRVT